MRFAAFIDYINQGRKRKNTFNNIKEEFIEKGYENFLFLTYSEEQEITSDVEKKMKEMKSPKVPDLLLPIIQAIEEISVLTLICICIIFFHLKNIIH